MRKPFLITLLFSALFFGCRMNETPKAQVDDLKITADLKSKLASDVGLSSVTDVSVNSTNGVVTLSGAVDSADKKNKAESVAKSIPNVASVVDNIQVVQTRSATNP